MATVYVRSLGDFLVIVTTTALAAGRALLRVNAEQALVDTSKPPAR